VQNKSNLLFGGKNDDVIISSNTPQVSLFGTQNTQNENINNVPKLFGNTISQSSSYQDNYNRYNNKVYENSNYIQQKYN
jgi:hypothetical protein